MYVRSTVMMQIIGIIRIGAGRWAKPGIDRRTNNTTLMSKYTAGIVSTHIFQRGGRGADPGTEKKLSSPGAV
jgi:hypothetical protein